MTKHFKSILKVLVNIALVLLIAIGLFVGFTLLPFKGNIKIYTIMSGSMEPTLHVGSIILVKPKSSYSIGDIITFKTSDQSGSTVTHRISAEDTSNTPFKYRTKGDANNANDTQITSGDQIIGKMIFTISAIGYILRYIKTVPGLVLIVIIPATIIIYEEVKKIHRETKSIIQKRRKTKKVSLTNKKGKNEKN